MTRRSIAIGLAWFVLAWLEWPAPAHAQPLRIESCRARGDSVEVVARMDVRARPEQVWQVLTDYERMPRFVPGLRRSRRIRAGREGPLVEQVAVARVLVFERHVMALLQMDESTPGALGFRAVAGDFKRLRGNWKLEALGGGWTRIFCRCVAAPRRSVPKPLLAWATRHEITPRMRALGREAERRSGAR